MLQKITDIITEKTKWHSPQKMQNGHCCFRLESSVLCFFSPNGQDIVFYVKLADIPQENADSWLDNIAKKAAGMYKRKKSAISVKDNALVLYRVLKEREITESSVTDCAKELLNDADLWNTVINGDSVPHSPFSFSFGGFNSL